MHIAVLSDPNNFHTIKWVKALEAQGPRVTVFSYEPYRGEGSISTEILTPPSGVPGEYSYRDYLRGGELLRIALISAKVDLLCALNVTPFGVWAMESGFHPTISIALGADILEYTCTSPEMRTRSWDNTHGETSLMQRFKAGLKRNFFMNKVQDALDYADLIVTDTDELVSEITGAFGLPAQKVRKLRWGVEPSLFHYSADQQRELNVWLRNIADQYFPATDLELDSRIILSPRGANAFYRADIILEGFEKFIRSEYWYEEYFIMFSGGYPISDEVARKAAALEKTGRFRLIRDQIPRADMHGIWRLAGAFVMGPVYDGFSASLAEGMYTGAFPILADLPAYREAVVPGKTGLILQEFTPEGVYQGLIHWINLAFEELEDTREKNRIWVEENALMDRNAAVFVNWCREIMG